MMNTWNDGTYLAHHGIKGQKWGVRRFQNEDGSLTSAGRSRYGVALTNVGKNLGGLVTRSLAESRKRRHLSNYQNADGTFNKAGRDRFNIKTSDKKVAYRNAKAELQNAKMASKVEMKRQSRRSLEEIDDSALDKVFDREMKARQNARQAKLAYKNSDEYRRNKAGEQAAWKAQRRETIRNTSAGARVAVFLTQGPFGLYNYNSLRAKGDSGGVAFAKSFATSWLGGPIGNAVYSSIIADNEKLRY